jgi:hypothetical protein
MGATGVRLTLKFNFAQQIRAAGWSESYDLGFADLSVANAALASINAFIVDRVNCLGIGPLLVNATLSAYVQPLLPGAPPVRRSTLSIPVPAFPTAGEAYNKALSHDATFSADFAVTVLYLSLQTNLAGTPVYRRNVWMAGLPDASDQTSSGVLTEPNTVTAVNKFLGDLQNSNPTLGGKCSVSIRSIDRSGANPVKQCTAWNLGPNTYTVPAHGFVVGQPIIAEGCKTQVGGIAPRGRYLVGTVVDVNTITLQDAAVPTPPIKTGGFRAAIVAFNGVFVATQKGFTKRDKGRPSGLSVGRRRRSLIKPA